MSTFFSMENPVVVLIRNHLFLTGFLSAVCLILAGAALYLFLMRKSVRSIRVPGEFGAITVSTMAIEGLICSLEADFPDIHAQRVLIRREQNLLTLHIVVDFKSKTTNLLEICRTLQKAALDTLQRVVGVIDIKNVSIDIRRCVVCGKEKTETSDSGKTQQELPAAE